MKYITDRVRGIILLSINWQLPVWFYLSILHFYTKNSALFLFSYSKDNDYENVITVKLDLFWNNIICKKYEINRN